MAEKKDLSALYEFDEAVGNEFPGGLICGTDEAGRGPIAGPVVIAGVIFEKGFDHMEIYDSKKLTEKKRENRYVKNPLFMPFFVKSQA